MKVSRIKFRLLLTALCLCTSAAQAVSFRIVGKNDESLFQVSLKVAVPTVVGSATVTALEQNTIPFEGSAYGISKIFELGQDIEVISDTEMKAYGWCFAIDGLVAETLPDETLILKQVTTIEWFYAFAHYKNGNWIGQCVRD